MHPWDHDNAFYSGDWVVSNSGELAQCCRRDEGCHARFHESLEELGLAVQASGLLGEVDDVLDMLEPHLRDDPRLEFDMDDVEDGRSDLPFWLQVRSTVLSNYPSL